MPTTCDDGHRRCRGFAALALAALLWQLELPALYIVPLRPPRLAASLTGRLALSPSPASLRPSAAVRRCGGPGRAVAGGEDWLGEAAWRDLGHSAGLHVGAAASARRGGAAPERAPPGEAGAAAAGGALDEEALREQMLHDGYIKMDLQSWASEEEYTGRLQAFASAIDRLEEVGLPPQFLLVFDEVWEAVNAVAATLGPVFGLQNIMDFFVFNVKPGGVGWPLHRDRLDPRPGFQPNGLPEYTTVWIAVSDARPETSCIYILPAHADPDYKAHMRAHDEVEDEEDEDEYYGLPEREVEDEEDEDEDYGLPESEERDERLIIGENHQHIRALPVPRGSVLVWSHRVLHWGSAAPLDAPEPRRALTFAMADAGLEEPLLDLPPSEDGAGMPQFEARLAIVAYTLICYHHMEPLPSATRSLLLQILHRHASHLTDAALMRHATGDAFGKALRILREEGEGDQAALAEGIEDYVWTRSVAAKMKQREAQRSAKG